MKPKRWQAVVMVAFACVLWKSEAVKVGTSWSMEGAYERISECESDIKKFVDTYASLNEKWRLDWLVTPNSPRSIKKLEGRGKSLGNRVELYCLPTQNLHPRDLYYRALGR